MMLNQNKDNMNFLQNVGSSIMKPFQFLTETAKSVLTPDDAVTYEEPAEEVALPIKPEAEPETKRRLSPSDIRFQESSEGFRGMPYIGEGEDSQWLDEYEFEPTPVTNPITSLQIEDPRDATADEFSQQGVTITDPEQLKVFNTIKSVADEVAPEYTDYLMRLAWYEGRGNAQNRLDNGERGVDRGIFQINSKSFPDVPDEFADDPVKSTLWAISAIESGNQEKWRADEYVKNAKTNITYSDNQ